MVLLTSLRVVFSYGNKMKSYGLKLDEYGTAGIFLDAKHSRMDSADCAGILS